MRVLLVEDEPLISEFIAKGLREHVVVLRHALRNALVPIVTLGALGDESTIPALRATLAREAAHAAESSPDGAERFFRVVAEAWWGASAEGAPAGAAPAELAAWWASALAGICPLQHLRPFRRGSPAKAIGMPLPGLLAIATLKLGHIQRIARRQLKDIKVRAGFGHGRL